MRKFYIAVLLFSLVLTSVTYSQMFGNEPAERQSTYDVEHIKIEVRIDLKNKSLDGVVTALIRPLTDDFKSFKVDAVGMNIKSVKECIYNHTDNPELAESYEEIPFDYDKKEITVKLPYNASKNFPFKYRVEYSVTDPEKGLYFIAPDSIFPNKRYEAWTQGEGEDNRYWFPCYDYPNDKATTEVIITANSEYRTLSNGELSKIIVNQDGTRTWHWALNKPHSSYLVMLAVGNYDVIEDGWQDIPIFSYGAPGTNDNIKTSYKETANIIKFFSDYSNYKYPWGRFSQVAVQDFIYGGMENTGAVVLFDGSVYDNGIPPDYTATGLVAHELAHMWWGDAVTCKNWNEIWLNEGFATYFEALYKEYTLGKDEFDYSILRKRDEVLEVDSVNRVPVYARKGLTTNTYSKGALVLNMLRHTMGDENFRKALHNYITKNEYKNVVTKNLVDEVNGVFNNPGLDRTPVDYSYFFDEWIYKAGQPEYKVNYNIDKNSNELILNIEQIQNREKSSIFRLSVDVEIVTDKSRRTEKIEIAELYSQHRIKLDGKLLNVNFNAGDNFLCKAYVTKPKDQWFFQLDKSPNAIDRIMAVRGVIDFINDADVIEKLSEYLKTDKFWGARYEISLVLANSNSNKIPEILMNAFDNEADSRVKRAILSGLGNYYTNFSTAPGRDKTVEFIIEKTKNESRCYVIAEGISAISKIADKSKVFDMVSPYIEQDSHVDIIRRSVLDALVESKDGRALDIFKEYAVKGSTSRVRSIAVSGLEGFLSDQSVIDILNLKLFDRNRYIRFRAVEMLGKSNSLVSRQYLETLLNETNDDNLRDRIKEVLKKVN